MCVWEGECVRGGGEREGFIVAQQQLVKVLPTSPWWW